MTDAWVYREPPQRPRHPPTQAILPATAARWRPQPYSQAAHLARLSPWLLEEARRASDSGGMRLSFGPPPAHRRPDLPLGFAPTQGLRAATSPRPPVGPPQRNAAPGKRAALEWTGIAVMLALVALAAWQLVSLYAGGLHP
jgi:hypothetical protein